MRRRVVQLAEIVQPIHEHRRVGHNPLAQQPLEAEPFLRRVVKRRAEVVHAHVGRHPPRQRRLQKRRNRLFVRHPIAKHRRAAEHKHVEVRRRRWPRTLSPRHPETVFAHIDVTAAHGRFLEHNVVVVGRPAKPKGSSEGNPDWTRDELVVQSRFSSHKNFENAWRWWA